MSRQTPKKKYRICYFFLLLVFFLGLVLLVPIGDVRYRYLHLIYDDLESLPEARTALVLGAAVWTKDRPSHALEDRLLSAIDLLQAKKVQVLLFSGDNALINYNEPQTMKNYAMRRGVPENKIVLDYAGFRTYDSCYRAKEIFGQNRIVIVTHDFHLPRSLYICRQLGIDAIGYSADRRFLKDHFNNQIREFFASWLAWIEVQVLHPEPRFLGEKEGIVL